MSPDTPENWRYSEEEQHEEIAEKDVRNGTFSREDTDVSVVVGHGSGPDGYCYHVLFRMYEYEYKNEIMGSTEDFEDAVDLASEFVEMFEARFEGESQDEILRLADRVLAEHDDLETDHGFSLS